MAASNSDPHSFQHHSQCESCPRLLHGKKGLNMHTTKRISSRNSLCNLHRIRANLNQRRMPHRVRMKQAHAQAVLSARLSGSVASGPYDWPYHGPSVHPQWGHHHSAGVTPCPPSSPQRHVRRPAARASFGHSDLGKWRHEAIPASLPSLEDSSFVDEYPWQEFAQVRHGGFVWSDQEFWRGMNPGYDR